jgi:hypothetical protein
MVNFKCLECDNASVVKNKSFFRFKTFKKDTRYAKKYDKQ